MRVWCTQSHSNITTNRRRRHDTIQNTVFISASLMATCACLECARAVVIFRTINIAILTTFLLTLLCIMYHLLIATPQHRDHISAPDIYSPPSTPPGTGFFPDSSRYGQQSGLGTRASLPIASNSTCARISWASIRARVHIHLVRESPDSGRGVIMPRS